MTPHVVVVVLTAHGEWTTYLNAMNSGAHEQWGHGLPDQAGAVPGNPHDNPKGSGPSRDPETRHLLHRVGRGGWRRGLSRSGGHWIRRRSATGSRVRKGCGGSGRRS